MIPILDICFIKDITLSRCTQMEHKTNCFKIVLFHHSLSPEFLLTDSPHLYKIPPPQVAQSSWFQFLCCFPTNVTFWSNSFCHTLTTTGPSFIANFPIIHVCDQISTPMFPMLLFPCRESRFILLLRPVTSYCSCLLLDTAGFLTGQKNHISQHYPN